MTRHILGLFHGQPRARAFRRHLAENAHLDGAGIEVLQAARRIVAGEERSRLPQNKRRRSLAHLVMPGTAGQLDPMARP